VTLADVEASAGGSSVNIVANEDFLVDRVAAGTVTLEANGNIIGQNLNNLAPVDISALNLNLAASDSILGNFIPSGTIFTPASSLTTDANNINAIALNNIAIADTGANGPVTLGDVEANAAGSLNVVANQDLLVDFAAAGTVTLESSGNITGQNLNNLAPVDIGALTLNLNAGNSINGAFTPTGTTFTPAASVTTNANLINAFAANAIDIFDTAANGAVTIANAVVSNLVFYGNVTLEALNGNITGENLNGTPASTSGVDILDGNLFLSASGNISGAFPPTNALTTNSSHNLASGGSITIFDSNHVFGFNVATDPASIDIVVNGSINVGLVSAFKKLPPLTTPEGLLLGGGINGQIQTAAGGVSFDHGLGSGFEAQPSFFFYHPLTDIDSSSFDNITLDAGAYDFIEDELKNRKGPIPSFFGT